MNRRELVFHSRYHGSVGTSGNLYDLSGQNSGAAMVGDAFIDSNGLNVDGSGDYATLTLPPISNGELSALVWAKFNTLDHQKIISKKNIFNVGTVSGKSYMQVFTISDGEKAIIPDTPVFYPGQWVLLGLTWKDNEIFKAIMNDTIEVAATGSIGNIITSSDNTKIGTQATALFSMSGFIDEIFIFHRYLSDEEILNYYHKSKGRYSNPPGFVLVSDYYTSPLFFPEDGTSNGKPKYVAGTNSYIEWDGVSDWNVYLDDGSNVLSFSITDSSDTPPESPSNIWTQEYYFTMSSLTKI